MLNRIRISWDDESKTILRRDADYGWTWAELVYLSPSTEILLITAMGQQRRQMTLPDKFGFPRTKAKTSSSIQGFKTGDLVQANVPIGKKVGSYLGRVAVRVSGNFDIRTRLETVQGISHRYCQLLQHSDGYSYE